MKKIFLILAMLMLAAPAFGDVVTITAAQVSDTKEVTISYLTSGQLPRAFALDITVDNSQTIDDVTDFFVGECNDSNGYGIFPASFARVINADFNNWDDANYTPVADVNDLPGDTEGGIGTGGITIEMGSLYAAPKGPPETSGILCSIWVSGDCNVSFSVNVGRAGVVMEDGNDANSSPHSLVLDGGPPVLVICTVPDVVGDPNLIAQAAISVDFTIGDITTACSLTVADGNVISTDPAAFTTPGCGTDVNIVVSTGPLASVPDVEDMNEADAIAAINAVGGLSVDTVSYACSDTIADGNVISTTPVAGPTCDATVDIVVSDGQPTVPNVVGDTNAAAQTAINAVDYISVGNVTTTYTDCSQDVGEVVSQSVVGVQPCSTTVDIVVRGHACGDLNCDGYVRFDDRGTLTGLLTTYGIQVDRKTTITQAMAQWDPMADLNNDGYMRFDDRGTLTGLLTTFGVQVDRKTTIVVPHIYGNCP